MTPRAHGKKLDMEVHVCYHSSEGVETGMTLGLTHQQASRTTGSRPKRDPALENRVVGSCRRMLEAASGYEQPHSCAPVCASEYIRMGMPTHIKEKNCV